MSWPQPLSGPKCKCSYPRACSSCTFSWFHLRRRRITEVVLVSAELLHLVIATKRTIAATPLVAWEKQLGEWTRSECRTFGTGEKGSMCPNHRNMLCNNSKQPSHFGCDRCNGTFVLAESCFCHTPQRFPLIAINFGLPCFLTLHA